MIAQPELLDQINPEHIPTLQAGLHAPSAHNAQPWRIHPVEDGVSYDLYHDNDPSLPEDPHDIIAGLNMGALVETLVLEGPNHGFEVGLVSELARGGRGLLVARIALSRRSESESVDPLSEHITDRVTNRNKYTDDKLPRDLNAILRGLGNVLLPPTVMRDVVTEASIEAWADARFVKDLITWMRANNDAPDGITPAPFNLSRADLVALHLAGLKGSFKSRAMGKALAARDVGAFTNAPMAAILGANEASPAGYFEAGRRLVRSWTEITASGHAYHPFSGAVFFDSTRPEVADMTGLEMPVALYRVGKAQKAPRGLSNRRPLGDLLV